VSRPHGTYGGARPYFHYLNSLYSSRVPNSIEKVKGTRKQMIEYTDKTAASFKMYILCNNEQAQIPPTRAKKEKN